MLNVFIIDDEIHVRKWLSFCISHQAGSFAIVGESSNVQEGLSLLRDLTVDILFLDIMLPGINGLDALEKIKQLHPDVSIIMLTNYAEFEYIQKAIHRGAEEYFLKSELTEKDLTACLKKLETKKRHLHPRKGANYDRLTLQSLGTQIVSRTITSKEQFLAAAAVYPKPDIFTYNLIVIALKHGKGKAISLKEEDLPEISPYLSTACAFPCGKDITLIACELDKLKSSLAIINTFTSITRHLSSRLSFHYMGISNVYYDFSDFYFAVTEALLSMNYGFYRSPKSVTYIWGTNPGRLKKGDFENFQREILAPAERKDYGKMEQALQSLFVYLKDTEPYDLLEVVRSLQNLAFLVISVFLKDNPAAHLPKDMQSSLAEFESCRYLDEIRMKMTGLFHSLTNTGAVPSYSAVIADALAYLDEHFCENLTLQDLSKVVHMNADYLGKLFKKEVGLSYNNYLTRKKMAYADYLIRTTNLKKYEIAEKIGYSNFSYFSRIYNAYKAKK